MNDEEGKRGEIEEIEEKKRSRRKSLLTVAGGVGKAVGGGARLFGSSLRSIVRVY